MSTTKISWLPLFVKRKRGFFLGQTRFWPGLVCDWSPLQTPCRNILWDSLSEEGGWSLIEFYKCLLSLPRELKEKIQPEILELIKQQRLNRLVEGTCFRKLNSRRRQGTAQTPQSGFILSLWSVSWAEEYCFHWQDPWLQCCLDCFYQETSESISELQIFRISCFPETGFSLITQMIRNKFSLWQNVKQQSHILKLVFWFLPECPDFLFISKQCLCQSSTWNLNFNLWVFDHLYVCNGVHSAPLPLVLPVLCFSLTLPCNFIMVFKHAFCKHLYQ